jgi:hypothetical protein
MPPVNPADLLVQARRELALTWQLQQPRMRLPPDPSHSDSDDGSTVRLIRIISDQLLLDNR